MKFVREYDFGKMYNHVDDIGGKYACVLCKPTTRSILWGYDSSNVNISIGKHLFIIKYNDKFRYKYRSLSLVLLDDDCGKITLDTRVYPVGLHMCMGVDIKKIYSILNKNKFIKNIISYYWQSVFTFIPGYDRHYKREFPLNQIMRMLISR